MQNLFVCITLCTTICMASLADEDKKKEIKKKSQEKPKVVKSEKKEDKELSYLFMTQNKSLEERKKESEAAKGPKPVKTRAGKTAEWTVNNIVKYNGWSMTGWSKLHLDKDFNRRWFKVGIVSGEIEGAKQMEIQNEADKWEEFKRYERHISQDVVFGIFFVIEF